MPHRIPRRKVIRRARALAAISLGLCLTSARVAEAASWVGGSGAWSDPNNWSPTGVPAPDTDVFITHNDSLDRLITFDHDYPQPIGAFILDQTGPGATTFSMSANTFGTSYQNIDKQEIIGLSGRATFLQSGGTNAGGAFNEIRLALHSGSAGTYNFSGGTISAAGLMIGNGGAGTFIHSAGTASLSYAHLGIGEGSSGTLTLSGTASFITTLLFCAQSGSGQINQSGGRLQATTMAMGTNDGPAVFNLSGGTFTAGQMILGHGGFPGLLGTAVVNQSGGSATVADLRIGNGQSTPGTWSITGGSLRVTGDFEIGRAGHGSFSMSSGANVTFGGYLTLGLQSTGAGTFALSGGTFTATGESVGDFGQGTFIQTGGTHIATRLILGDGDSGAGTYLLGGGTFISGNTYVGGSGIGVFNQTGGAHVVTNSLNLAEAYAFGCAYNLSGGTVSAVRMNNAIGTFTQTGGVATFTHGITGFGAVQVSGTGRLYTSRIEQFELHVGTGGFVACAPNGAAPGSINYLRKLSISGGTWDLSDNDLVVEYGPFPLTGEVVRGYIASAYAGGNWSGPGLTSSAAAAAGSGPKTALGYADAADLFTSFPALWNGTVINEWSMLVRYTVAGDSNLDGVVNLADFNRLAAHFGQGNRLWSEGDFNYDGAVNLNDFNLLAANFGLSATSPEGPTPGDWAALAAAVPEPMAAGLCSIPALVAVLRRRRRSRVSDIVR